MFTQDWIHNKDIVPHWVTHLEKFKGQPIQMLEVGCYEGRSTLWFMEHILTDVMAKMTVVDTFEGDEQQYDMGIIVNDLESTFRENLKDHLHKIYVCRGKSQEILRNLKTQYDLIYIDGSHYQTDVMIDAVLSYQLLKKNGILIFDDYAMTHLSKDNTYFCPKIALDAFLTVFGSHTEILHKGWQLIIKKN